MAPDRLPLSVLVALGLASCGPCRLGVCLSPIPRDQEGDEQLRPCLSVAPPQEEPPDAPPDVCLSIAPPPEPEPPIPEPEPPIPEAIDPEAEPTQPETLPDDPPRPCLSVRWEPREEGWELEPNQQNKDALTIKPGTSVRGYLGSVSDRDLYKVEGDKGKLAGLVTGIDGVDLVMEITPDGGKTVVVDKETTSSGEEFHGVKVAPGKPVIIGLRRKNAKKLNHRVQAKSLEKTYSLKTWIVPGK